MEYRIRIESLDPTDDRHFNMIVVDEDLPEILKDNTTQLVRMMFK